MWCALIWIELYLCQVSNMLVPSEGPKEQVTVSNAMLLSFYEAINLNRNFITVLTHVRT